MTTRPEGFLREKKSATLSGRPLNMASLSPLPRRFLPLVLVCTLFAAGGAATFAQDTTPPANGTTAYQNSPVNAILDFYEQLSGKHLIRDTNLGGVPNISLNANGLNKADTLKLIETDLLLNGVAFVPVDANTLKVITVGTNKNVRSEAPPLFANAVDLPTTDEVVSYYMPLSYISPSEAQGIFTSTAPVHTYGAYTPAPSAQAIILTENTSVIRQLIALKELIDVPPAKVTTEFVQLNRADSDKVADTLNKMLGQSATGAPVATGPNAATVPAAIGNNEPLSNERNLISGAAQVFSVPRSNQLILITRPVNMPFLEKMIAQLDQIDTFQAPARRPLRYVVAQDILPALESSLAQGKDEDDAAKKDATTAQSGGSGNQQQGTQPQQQSNSSASAGAAGAAGTVTPQLQTPKENDVPSVVTVGNTKILADNRSNSIIVFGSPDAVARVFNMIDQLDQKPLQVSLATVIGQLTVSEGLEFGIDILQKFQRVGQGGFATGLIVPGTTTAGSAAVPEPSSLTSALGFPLPTGLTLYGAIGSTLDAYVRALENTNRFKIISRPSVFTTNNKLAVITSGSEVPVPSSITSGFNGGGTTTDDLTTTASVDYQKVLLELDIIPLINHDREVTLKIRQTNNSLGVENVISGNEVPTILTQEINTEVTVPDKSTVVIGGLISDTTHRTTSGVPFLSDIPILGYLFKDTTKNKERDELIIMIQPSVVANDADMLRVNEEEKQRTILGREAVEAATGTTTPETVTTITTVTPAASPAVVPVVDTKEINSGGTTYNSKTGRARTTTTTTTTMTAPVVPTADTPTGPSVVPILSSPAPDVSNGQMPHYAPAPGVTPAPGH
jgi:general secretion pathway protein D